MVAPNHAPNHAPTSDNLQRHLSTNSGIHRQLALRLFFPLCLRPFFSKRLMRFVRCGQHAFQRSFAARDRLRLAVLIAPFILTHGGTSMTAADDEDPRFREHMKWLGHVAAISA